MSTRARSLQPFWNYRLQLVSGLVYWDKSQPIHPTRALPAD
jgi:hypothetical protein